MKYVSANDDAEGATLVRNVDLQQKFRYPRKKLAEMLKITLTESKRLREMLGIDEDNKMCHTFVHQSQRHPCFSDQAFIKMKDHLAQEGVRELIRQRKKPL